MNALNFGRPRYRTGLIALVTLVHGLLNAQTPLSNGINQAGSLAVNTTNRYTLGANTADSVILRLGTTGFDGFLELVGPAGNSLKSAASGNDAELDYTPTNSGTFTVLVSSYYSGQAGSYVLHLAQFPEPFSVSPGEAGGAMTNGGSDPGTNNLGDLNLWSFTAEAGDTIVLRLGTTNYDGDLSLYGPQGNLLKTSVSGTDAEIDLVATNSGRFTALVDSYYTGGTGTYELHLAQFPEPFIVPVGAQGGPMTNGGAGLGTSSLGDLSLWSFGANIGDNIVLRLGTTNFDGDLSLYGPKGNLLKTAASGTDAEIDLVATNSGRFTALVDSYYTGGTGTYELHLAQFPEPFIVPVGAQGGPMTNGGTCLGANSLGDLSLWSFAANTGDNIVLRLGTTNFDGDLSLYGPEGNLLKTAASGTDAQIAYTATNAGTFTALVDSYLSGGLGTYALYLAEFPEPFIVPAGDEGGALVSGGKYAGTITMGELGMWSFNANVGSSVVLRLGTANFDGDLSLYGPNGNLIKTSASGTDADIAFTPTNTGTFTALVDSYYSGGTGTYVLYFVQFPGSFIVPPGDDGGALSGATRQTGTITTGDLDPWVFTACTGDMLQIELDPTNFVGNLALYGAGGNLLETVTASGPATLNYVATNCGDFYILVSSYYSGGAGSYGLAVNHLAYQTRLCLPEFMQGTNLVLTGVGGITNAGYTLYSTTNLTGPVIVWTPLITNTFDQYGVLTYTNIYNGEPPKVAFFRFAVITN